MSSIRLALRTLAKTPGFTATAIATIALCLGANLAIFAVVDAVLVRCLPFPEPDRLVTLFNSYPGAGVAHSFASMPNYWDRRGTITACSSLALYQDGSTILGEAGNPDRVPSARVTPEFFATLGTPLAMGQSFAEEHLRYGDDNVAVITDGFWRSYFNADPAVLGRTFLGDGYPITVIGVLPRTFRFLSSPAQFYRPAAHAPEDRQPQARHSNNWNMVARLGPESTIVQAQSQIDAFNLRQAADDPIAEMIKNIGYHTTVAPLHADHVQTVKPTLTLLQAGVVLLLLISGVNLVNLLLIRANGRTQELAVRQALGAGRRHIVSLVVAETMLLSLCGGVLGLLLGSLGIDLLRTMGAGQLPLGSAIEFNSRLAVSLFTLAIGIGLALSVPIIWFHLRARVTPSLRPGSRAGCATRSTQRVRHGFVITQIALAFVLLTSAGLLAISLKRVLDTSPGFNPSHILTGQVQLTWRNYQKDTARIAFVERLLANLRALPGVSHAAIATGLPFTGSISNSALDVDGYTPVPGEPRRAHYLAAATADYWPMLRIPLLRGRLLEDADNHRAERVCLVDQAFANRYWPDSDPLGHHISFGPGTPKATIVGVVADVKQAELGEASGFGTVYFDYAGFNSFDFSLVVRSEHTLEALAPLVRKTMLALDPELPVDDLRTLQARIDDSLLMRRSPAILATIFAVIALLLAAIGTYGVLAYAVGQRQHEIGIRMALGALPKQICTYFLRLGARLLVIGIILGAAGAWAASRAMDSMLFGIHGRQAAILSLAVGVMAGVVLLAIILPARRASRVDPLEALRAE
ncbi:MAG TPA: ABC transporter permease [Opitutaceae bacterium]|nr:ABC transporter permease [Opitutaceae bacterium]